MIKLVDVSKYYKTESTVVMGLHKINLEFSIGEFVAITGESGSGKSTLLNVISGVDSYEDGELYIDNEETSYYSQADFEKFRKEQVAFIFQNYNLIDNYTVLQNVEAALIIKGVEKEERKNKAKDILERVGLTSRIKAKTAKLSGGEKQRLAIARALAQETRFIVADEPTGNLDSENGKLILELLHELSKDKLIIIVTHNYEQVEPFITRKVRLFDGEVVEDKVLKHTELASEILTKNIDKTKKNIIKTPFKFATMNLLSQPKKTVLLLLVAFMTTFFIFAFYGGYTAIKQSMLDFGFSNSAYNNFDERIIINKGKDSLGNKIKLTDDDYDYLKTIANVDHVVKYEKGLDTGLQLSITEDPDYDLEVRGLYGVIPDVFPVSLISESDLLGGRLPENVGEIVIDYLSDSKKSENLDIAETLNNRYILASGTINLKIAQVSSNASFNIKNLKIVGITKENTRKFGVYLDDDTLKDFSNSFNALVVEAPNFSIKYNESDSTEDSIITRPLLKIGIDYSLEQNKFSASHDTRQVIDNLVASGAKNIEYYYNDQQIQIISDDDFFLYDNYFSPSILNNNEAEIYQYSLVVKDTTKLKTVMQILNSNGYNGLNYLLANENIVEKVPPEILLISLSFGIYAIFLLVIVYLFSYLSIRTILLSSKKNYNIFRVLGVSPKEIQIMSGIEVMFCFLGAYLLNLFLFVLIKNLNVKYVSEFIATIKITDYILLLFVNIVLSFFVATRYSKLLKKRSLMATVKVGG